MSKHTFWSRIVEDHLAGVFLCGADREGLHDLIYSLAKISSIDCVDLQFNAQYQPDLFAQPQERWAIVSLPSSKNIAKQIVDMSQQAVDKVLWILVDLIPEKLPASIQGEQVTMPTQTQWEKVLHRYMPYFKGPCVVPKDFSQAARFLREIFLTGDYLYADDFVLEGTSWKKFEMILERPSAGFDLSLSDLLHISYCLESLHQRAAFPSQALGFIPRNIEKMILTAELIAVLNNSSRTYYMLLLEAMLHLDLPAADRAFSMWLWTIRKQVAGLQKY